MAKWGTAGEWVKGKTPRNRKGESHFKKDIMRIEEKRGGKTEERLNNKRDKEKC